MWAVKWTLNECGIRTFDFDKLGRFSGRMVSRPDGEHGEVGDGSNESDAHPGSSEQNGRDVEEADQDDVPVKAAALPALLHQDESKGTQGRFGLVVLILRQKFILR